MHDSSKAAIVPAIITGVLLLLLMPLVFRKSASTISDIEEIALYAQALSSTDSVWTGNLWLFREIDPPLPGEAAFGTHNLFPYRLITVRDTGTGDVLVRILSPFDLQSNTERMNESNFQISAVVRNTDATVLIRNRDSNSWPARLFSIITD